MHPPLGVSVKVTLPPTQKDVGPPAEIVAAGFLFTVIIILDEVSASQPLTAIHEYVPFCVTV